MIVAQDCPFDYHRLSHQRFCFCVVSLRREGLPEVLAIHRHAGVRMSKDACRQVQALAVRISGLHVFVLKEGTAPELLSDVARLGWSGPSRSRSAATISR